MDEKYLPLYELLMSGLENDAAMERTNIVLYHPDVFVRLAQENIALREKIANLQRIERKYVDEVTYSLNLLDKLRYCAKQLESMEVRVPFKIDGTRR